MNKKIFECLVLFVLCFSFLFLIPQRIFAIEVIKSFDVEIIAHKDGTMTIEEDIIYDFGEDERHGIFRTIPLVSSVGNLYRVVEVNFQTIKRDGEEEEYEIDMHSQEAEVKIGDPDRTISGEHNYTIIYTVANGIGSNYEDHDEIYWNVTGNDWDVPVASASADVKTDFGVNTNRVACFTRSGEFNAQFCSFPPGKFTPITTTAPIEPGDGLTIVAGFPVNTFPKSTLQRSQPFWDPDFITFIKWMIPVYGFLNLLLAPYLVFWYLTKKRKKRFGSPSVNFDMPEYPKGKRITPAEAGTIDNTKLDKDDIIATIFDLAIRKYLKIEEVKVNRKFRPDTSDYKLTKLKDFTDLNFFEKELMEEIFKEGDQVMLKNTKLTFTDFASLEKKNFETLVNRGFYTKNPKSQMGALLVFGIIALTTLNLILGPLLIWLSRKLNGRTQLGDEMDWKTDGLKLFLKNMSRNYKWQAKNFYFVEKMIPYAMALGFIDEYMEQLKILKPDYSPTWYSGPGNFYAHYPYFSSSMSNNVTTSAPSSSSGFSGGSSGGGGGGGGGGSW